MTLDIASARASRPYTRGEYIARVAWGVVRPLFRFSPRLAHGWRRAMLRVFGATIGRRVHIDPSVRIAVPWMLSIGDDASVGEHVWLYSLGRIDLGPRSTVSHLAHLCAGTHDHRDPGLPLQRDPITVGADAWICAQAFVGPGVRVGEGAVVGAASVVVRDVPAWTIVAGNPARHLGPRNMGNAP